MIIDFTAWIIASALLLFPSFIKHFYTNDNKFSIIDSLFFIFIFLDSIPIILLLGPIAAVGQIEKDFFYMYLPFFAGKHFFKNKDSLFIFFNFLSIISIIVSLLGFYEFYTEQPLQIFTAFSTDQSNWETSTILHTRGGIFGTQRIAATFVHPIWLGVFVMAVFLINLLILFYYKMEPNKKYRILMFIQMLFALFILILSQSRTALVSFLITIIMFLIINRKGSIKQALLLLSFIGALLYFVYYYLSVNYSYFFQLLIYDNISSSYAADNMIGRSNIYIEMIILMFTHLNLVGEATVLNSDVQKFLLVTDMTNAFLSRLIANGIFGGLVFIILWVKAFTKSLNNLKFNKLFVSIFLVLFYFILTNNITTLRYQIEIISYIFLGLAFNENLLTVSRNYLLSSNQRI